MNVCRLRPVRPLSPLIFAAAAALSACASDADPTGPAVNLVRGPRVAAAPTSVTAFLDLRGRVTGFRDGAGVATVVFDGTTSEGQPLSGKGRMEFTAEAGPSRDVLVLKTAELRFRGTLGPEGASVEVRGQGGLDLADILIPRAGIVFLPITEFKGTLVPR